MERRLERHYRQEIRQRVYIIGGVGILLIILFFTIGLPILINGSSSFSHFLGGKRDASERTNPVLQSIEVDDIPPTINKSTIIISGRASNFDSISVYLNDEKLNEEELPVSGDFSIELENLVKGKNQIYLKAVAKNQEKTSQIYEVIYQAEKPKLEITEPGDNSTTDREEIVLRGTTGENITIKVDGVPIVVGAENKFQTNFRLKEGENKIKITAEDTAGNSEEKTLTVKYEKE